MTRCDKITAEKEKMKKRLQKIHAEMRERRDRAREIAEKCSITGDMQLLRDTIEELSRSKRDADSFEPPRR